MKGKLREIGFKKLIITAVVIILAMVIVIVAIITSGKDDKKAAGKEDVIEPVEEKAVLEEEAEEEISAETDNVMPEESATQTEPAVSETTETSKEDIIAGAAGNVSGNESSIKQRSFNEEFTKIYTEYSEYKTLYEGIGIDTDLKCAEIYFNNDNEVDYLFKGVEIYYLFIADENGYYVYDDMITGTHSSEYYYIEKTGTLIRFATGYYGDGGYEIYQLNDSYEEGYQYYIGEECIVDSSNNPILDENGIPQRVYLYSDKYERFEITADEYDKKLNELESKWTSLYEVTYKSLDEFSWFEEFTH